MKFNAKIALPFLISAPIALFAFKAPASNTSSNSLLKGAEVTKAYNELKAQDDDVLFSSRVAKFNESVLEETVATARSPRINEAYIKDVLLKYE